MNYIVVTNCLRAYRFCLTAVGWELVFLKELSLHIYLIGTHRDGQRNCALLYHRDDWEIIKVDLISWYNRPIKPPQQTSNDKSQLHPCQRLPKATMEADTKRTTCGELIIRKFSRPLSDGQPSFWNETIWIVEVLLRAVDGICPGTDASL